MARAKRSAKPMQSETISASALRERMVIAAIERILSAVDALCSVLVTVVTRLIVVPKCYNRRYE